MTPSHPLYNIRRGPHGHQLAKFDADLNLLAVYDVDPKHCSCPAGPRPTCKHRKMLPRMLHKVDTAEFYCYETQQWLQPIPIVEDNLASEASSCPEPEPVPQTEPALPPIEAIPPKPAPTPTIRRR